MRSKNPDFRIREYLKVRLTSEELDEILLKSGLKPVDLIRKQEEIFKKELKGRNFTDEEWKRIILENPNILVRPIVVGHYRAVVAQPAGKIDEVMK